MPGLAESETDEDETDDDEHDEDDYTGIYPYSSPPRRRPSLLTQGPKLLFHSPAVNWESEVVSSKFSKHRDHNREQADSAYTTGPDQDQDYPSSKKSSYPRILIDGGSTVNVTDQRHLLRNVRREFHRIKVGGGQVVAHEVGDMLARVAQPNNKSKLILFTNFRYVPSFGATIVWRTSSPGRATASPRTIIF